MSEMIPVVVLISGRGSNLSALLDGQQSGRLNISINRVISNRPDAGGLQYAQSRGVATSVIDHEQFPDRESFERAMLAQINLCTPRLIVLAGFMRILTPLFVDALAGRMINIHPSLLPKYTGLHTHRRALEAGDDMHGASIHFVTNELDGGPVISQVRIPVNHGETADTLAARLLPNEHRLMVATVELFSRHSVQLRDDRIYVDDALLENPYLLDDDNCLRIAGNPVG